MHHWVANCTDSQIAELYIITGVRYRETPSIKARNIMKAFLSYSSKDAHFVRQVADELGVVQCEFDERTFDFTLNTQAIRQALARSDIFVAFLSENSITSSFVTEEQRAALEARARGSIGRILIFCLDETSYKALPDWLQEINVVRTLSSPKTCARRIQSALISLAAESPDKSLFYIGRDEEEKALRSALSKPPGQAPVAIHSVGHYGIGRRTFLKRTMSKLFPRLDLHVEVTLSAYEGIEEFYRYIYSLHKVSSLKDSIRDFDAFGKLEIDAQVQIIAEYIEEMAECGEFIIIVDEGAVYDDPGDYVPFIEKLIRHFAAFRHPILGFAQSRMMPFSKRNNFSLAHHTYIKPLSETDIIEYLSFSLKQAELDYTVQQIAEIAEHIDGHPFNVRFAINFIKSYGIESLIADPSELIEWKRRRAEDFLSKIDFTDQEIEVLSILNEYRFIAIEMLSSLSGTDAVATARILRELEDWCCIERREGYVHISSPIREAVRRDSRFDRNDAWRKKLGNAMCNAASEYQGDDHIPIAIIQSATLAAARGHDAPAFLSSLILPSHLLRIARDYYDRDKRKLCMEFCKRAYEMKSRLPTDACVEVLRLWGLSAVRSGDKEAYENVLAELKKYPTTIARRNGLFLEGLILRNRHRFDDAEEKFVEAWKISKYNPSINRELASLYCKQGRFGDAEIHARSIYEVAPTNPFIIDILAETLLGKRQIGLPIDQQELNRILGELKIYGDAPGSSFWLTREAQRLSRDRSYKDALAVINRAIERTPTLLAAHFIRAEIDLSLKDIGAAKDDLKNINRLLTEAAGFSEGDEARCHELEAGILIEEKNYKAAKARIETSNFLSNSMRRRMLRQLSRTIGFDPKGADPSLQAWAKSFAG